MSIKELANKFISTWQQAAITGKTDEFKNMFDPSFVYHDALVEAKLEPYMEHIKNLHKSAKISNVSINYLVGEGNLFGLDFKAQYNFTSDVQGMPPVAGKEVKSHYLCILHVKNGKVNEGWSLGTSTGLD